ncbi:hypothetical protein LPJ76_001119 [Coemansia sp. RSA 638]|nr:hypothetical protein LPJ76_001119 [Coemansia sp. RSA 638]
MRASVVALARSVWKGPYFVHFTNLQESIQRGTPIKTMARSCTIMPHMIGALFEIHNGKSYVPLRVTEDMVGRKLGEFSHTRKRRIMASEVQGSNSTIQNVIQNNKDWVAEVQANNPDYFTNLAKGQSPKLLWIGCSDSRMAVDVLTQTKPGDVFIHRNIANRIPSEDLSALSVIEYAVKHLKVEHVIVAGHTSCGGIKAAMSNSSVGILDHWLRPVKDLYVANQQEIDALPEAERADRLGELNVIQGVNTVSKLPVVLDAWKEGRELYVHGWMLQLHTGLLKDLDVSVTSSKQVENIFQLN